MPSLCLSCSNSSVASHFITIQGTKPPQITANARQRKNEFMLNTHELDDERGGMKVESTAEKMRKIKRGTTQVYVFSILNYQLHIFLRLEQHLTLILGQIHRKLKTFSQSRNVSSHAAESLSQRINLVWFIYLCI